jgi:hypothetical protein
LIGPLHVEFSAGRAWQESRAICPRIRQETLKTPDRHAILRGL